MVSVVKLEAFNTLDEDGNLVSRNFKEMDEKLAALEASTTDATTEVKGIVELATNDETSTGTDSTRVVTPAGLAHVLDPIKKKLENVVSGVTNFAYKDYTQEDNQSEMEVGIVYLVPFNKSNQFIKLDPSTNAPAADQDPGVSGDTEIAYYVKCIKDSSGKVTSNDKIYTQGHLENVAYTNISNTFAQAQTFNNGITVTNNVATDTLHASGAVTLDNNATVSGSVTVSGDIVANKGIDIASGSGSTTVPNAGQVKTYVDSYLPEAKPVSSFETDLSGSGLVPGKIYFYYE